ncbi:unnamed protein product [Bursaphelenchus okinawaensis]|uniref:Uncharacterized protein n=1 Tax=Bursaphelenchus okinawaensis TaxID=465554 RepID=A0A811LNU8_9BILA|nr:unnamed protein product [Bursaphelenchus okinawaensis]CAG9127233.1 unnamed protein product [Bursaphelenchus okinawaensis]
MDEQEWQREAPSSGGGADELAMEMYPLVPPMFLKQFTGKTPFQFDRPIEYIIVWCDSMCCCEMVRNEEDATETVPLIIRFGGHCSDTVNKMYVGCVVAVRSYLEVKHVLKRSKMMPITSVGCDFRDMFYGGAPQPSAFALEWMVTYMPVIDRSLGLLVEDLSYGENFLYLRGKVRDYEYNEEITVTYEKWPFLKEKKLPPINTAVVLNYVKFVDPYISFTNKHGSQIPLPQYMIKYVKADKDTTEYVFGWVDLSLQFSRRYQ